MGEPALALARKAWSGCDRKMTFLGFPGGGSELGICQAAESDSAQTPRSLCQKAEVSI